MLVISGYVGFQIQTRTFLLKLLQSPLAHQLSYLYINTPGSRPFGHTVIIRRKEYLKALALCIKLLWEEKRKQEKLHPSLSRGFAACQVGSSLWLRLFCQASFGKVH
jgi:hypothetical protein